MDPEARAKAPILEVGKPGDPDYVKLIESEVVARYLDDAFPTPPLQPSHPGRKAEAHMLATTFMDLVMPSYNMVLGGKTQAGIDKAFVGLRRGLFAVENGLKQYSTGTPFFNGTFGLVEALVAPFVLRMLVNTKHHRGVDLLATGDLPRTVAWMRAIQQHPSCVETTPSDKSLCAIPPFMQPFFKGVVSPGVQSARPKTAKEAEAAFAASIDKGLVHTGKAARDRTKESDRNQVTKVKGKL